MSTAAPANPNVVLTRATPAQLRVSHERQLVEWGRGLTIEQFTARERHLIEQTGFGKTEQTWVLAPADDAETVDFYCSCETWRRPVLLSTPNSAAPSKVTRSIAYSIGSVFCPPQHRRRGYAERMMTLLHDKLALPAEASADLARDSSFESTIDKPWAPNDAALSFLYSDIGTFYNRCGQTPWVIQGVEKTTVWQVAQLDNVEETDELAALEPITAALFGAIALTDAAQLKRDLQESATTKPTFIVEPTEGVYDWLLARAQFAYDAQSLDLPEVWGFTLPPTASAGSPCPSFILFTIDPKRGSTPGTLKVVRLRSNEPREGAALLLRTLQFAQEREEVDKVVAWNAPAVALDELKEVKSGLEGVTGTREDSLSAVAVYGPLAQGTSGELVEWAVNEGYAWC